MQLDKCFIFYEPEEKKFIPFLQIVRFFLFLEPSLFKRNWYHILNTCCVDGELFIMIVEYIFHMTIIRANIEVLLSAEYFANIILFKLFCNSKCPIISPILQEEIKLKSV